MISQTLESKRFNENIRLKMTKLSDFGQIFSTDKEFNYQCFKYSAFDFK